MKSAFEPTCSWGLLFHFMQLGLGEHHRLRALRRQCIHEHHGLLVFLIDDGLLPNLRQIHALALAHRSTAAKSDKLARVLRRLFIFQKKGHLKMNAKHQPESTADELGSAAPSFYHMLRRIVARADGSTDTIMEAVVDEIAYENDEFEDEAERVEVARLVEVADDFPMTA